MRWNVGTKIGTGYGLALAILIAIGAVSYHNSVLLTDTAGWVAHTHQVLERLEDVLSTLKDAEAGQRGYLITGEERYLEPYKAARASIDQKLKGSNPDALRTLTKDNPNQQRRLDALEPLVDSKFAELMETIELRKDKEKGFDAALKVVLTDKGKNVMDEIRRKLGEMRDEELTLLETRSSEAKSSSETTKSTIVFGTLAAFVVLAIAAILITRNIARPVRELSATAERIAVGDLGATVSAASGRQDEIGALALSFSRMTASLKNMAGIAGKIADGDLRVKIKPQSELDVLGTAFASMIDNLQLLTADLAEGVNVLSTSANEISTSTSQLATSASESAAAVSETTTTVEEVRKPRRSPARRPSTSPIAHRKPRKSRRAGASPPRMPAPV
jgi:methyl-accepting chemotaxis protein